MPVDRPRDGHGSYPGFPRDILKSRSSSGGQLAQSFASIWLTCHSVPTGAGFISKFTSNRPLTT